jgi:hypothetical protein
VSLRLHCFSSYNFDDYSKGRKEIWDALKAAAFAAETNDFALAQAIIDGANISLPNGLTLFYSIC